MNKREAIDELRWMDIPGVAVGIQMDSRVVRENNGWVWYAARNHMEAQRWVNFNRDYTVPGTRPEYVTLEDVEG